MSYLITPSLLDSFNYFLTDWGNEDDFKATLKRERTEPNEAMQRGIDFENNVVAYINTGIMPKCKNPEAVAEVASYCVNGSFQVRLAHDVMVGDLEVCLYGRADYIGDDRIVDIKTTGTYKLGKYYTKMQKMIYSFLAHKMNMPVTKMQFVICSGNKVYVEEYPCVDYEAEIKAEIQGFLTLIKGTEYGALYKENWKSKA